MNQVEKIFNVKNVFFLYWILLHCSGHTKTWCKGRGHRSKARIGRRFKVKQSSRPTEQTDTTPTCPYVQIPPTPINPTDWLKTFNAPSDWLNVSDIHSNEMRLCQITHQHGLHCAPIVVSRSLIVKQDCSWILHVHGHEVDIKSVNLLSRVPTYLETESTNQLLETLRGLGTCIANPEPKFTELGKLKKNHQFLSANGTVVAFVDFGYAVDTKFLCTVRHSDCHMLTLPENKRCPPCVLYRNLLFSLCSRSGKSIQTHKNTNYR